jgi:phage I-like protein
MAEFAAYGNDLLIDYEHQTLNSEMNGQPAPAMGWFQVEAREDGIYAVNVRWTPRAIDALKSREYRYHSPVFAYDPDTMRVLSIEMESLVNYPATVHQTPLAAKNEPNVANGNDTHNPNPKAKDIDKMTEKALEVLEKERDSIKKQLEAAKAELKVSDKLLTSAMEAVECKDREKFLAICKADHDKAATADELTKDMAKLKGDMDEAEKVRLIEGASLANDKIEWLKKQSLETVKTYIAECGKEPEVSTTPQSAAAIDDPDITEPDALFVKNCEHRGIYDVEAIKKEWLSAKAWDKRHAGKKWSTYTK